MTSVCLRAGGGAESEKSPAQVAGGGAGFGGGPVSNLGGRTGTCRGGRMGASPPCFGRGGGAAFGLSTGLARPKVELSWEVDPLPWELLWLCRVFCWFRIWLAKSEKLTSRSVPKYELEVIQDLRFELLEEQLEGSPACAQ